MTEENDFRIYNSTPGLINTGGGVGMMLPPVEPQFPAMRQADMPSIESPGQSDKTLQEILSTIQSIASQMRNI